MHRIPTKEHGAGIMSAIGLAAMYFWAGGMAAAFEADAGHYQTEGPTLNHGEGTLKALGDR